MDTDERKAVRAMAFTMEATYRGDPNGLRAAQEGARGAVDALRELFPGETDDTLCCVARAVSSTVARIAQIPVQHAGSAMEGVIAAYPLAAGVLAGVYMLPEGDGGDAEAMAHAEAQDAEPGAGDRNPMTGQYLLCPLKTCRQNSAPWTCSRSACKQ